MIKTNNLKKTFNDLIAVDNLNLDIKKGEIYAMIGPNGAGKTTTVKMLVGILPPTEGLVEIAGYDIQKEPIKAKKKIGYISDSPYVYPYITGREFLEFVAEIYKVDNSDKKIEKLLKIFPVKEIIDGYFKDFSRGTKQKLTILATLLHEPEVLIIDEPILGLDPQSTQITEKILKDFRKKGGSVFICTHTLSFIENLTDRIGVIDKGKIIFEGTLDQLKTKVHSKEKELEKLFLKLTK